MLFINSFYKPDLTYLKIFLVITNTLINIKIVTN